MNKFIIILFLGCHVIFGQNIKLPTLTPEQKEHANTIRISEVQTIEYKNYNKVNLRNTYRIMVLNEIGFNTLNLSKNYDKSNKIKKLNVSIYNSFGYKIKQFEKTDFKDRSLIDNSTIFSDDRLLYLDYTPTSYPFIIEYDCETESVNTAFLQAWSPISYLNETILSSTLEIIKNPVVEVQQKSQKLQEFGIIKTETPEKISYTTPAILAVKPESYTDYSKEFPKVKLFLNKASLEGYELNMSSWDTFGKMYYDYFIKENSTISEKTKLKLDQIISPSDSKLDKIKKIYQYVQNNTRYVSIQVGVGGWKPMATSDVEKYGYGDCKALSNFTRSLLNAYDIEAYYTVIYGGNKRKFEEDVISMQGNHVIVSVPNEDGYIFLECTSQTNPFAYLSDFTSNRNALLIKADGAEIIDTDAYRTQQNTQVTSSTIELLDSGSISGSATIISNHLQYKNVIDLELKSAKEQTEYYSNHFSHLNNLILSNVKFQNDKNRFSFTEKFTFKADNYVEKSGNTIILPLNVLNRSSIIPTKYRNKKFAFEIEYGYTDSDEIELVLPKNYSLTQLPEAIVIKEKFGEYQASVVAEKDKLLYKRKLIVNEGVYPKEDYESYRKFKEQISKSDNIKIIIDVK